MRARVHVVLKPGVLDPQGAAIGHAIADLGFAGVEAVRQGKYFELDLAASADAETKVRAICQSLLANPVIESYTVDIDP